MKYKGINFQAATDQSAAEVMKAIDHAERMLNLKARIRKAVRGRGSITARQLAAELGVPLEAVCELMRTWF